MRVFAWGSRGFGGRPESRPYRKALIGARFCASVGLVVLLALMGFSVSADDGPPPQGSSRFGIVEGFWFPEVTCELGVGWERIIFDWSQHQPGGPADWHTLNVDDRWLKAANLCQREVVALLKNTPEWATDGTPGIGVPRGLDLNWDDPANVWGAFVYRAADYYASRGVNHFIIWNEPDITADTYGYEFEGSMDDYIRMLRVAYQAAKAANPSAVLHLAGTTYWHDVNAGRTPYVQRLIERLADDPEAAEHHYYFDVLSLHIYFRTDTVYDIVHEMRALLDEHGMTGHTIWINETNAAPTDDPNWPVERPVYDLDLEHQANFLVQAASLALAADVQRMAVYKLWDQNLPPGGESFGLLTPGTGARRPAFDAWQTVIALLDDVTEARLARTATLDVVQLDHLTPRSTLVAWARTPDATQIQVQAVAQKAYLLHHDGTRRVIFPQDGFFTLDLPGARCNDVDGCPVGGAVRILVQPWDGYAVHEASEGNLETLEFEDD